MNKQRQVKRNTSFLWLLASLFASLAGVIIFIYLFVLDFNLYWFILSPVIFAIYQIPAVYLFWRWKKKKEEEKKEK